MSVRIRWSATAVALAVAAALLGHRGGAPDTALRPAELLPAAVAAWRATEERRLAPAELGADAPDRYRLRAFRAADGAAPIWAYAAYYSGRPGRDAHDPALCYPAQGWEVVASRSLELTAASGAPVPARLLEVRKGVRRERVLYWSQPAGRAATPGLRGELRRVADVLAGRPHFAFVRLSQPLEAGAPTPSALIRFAAALVPRVRRALDPAAAASPDAPGTAT